jgi:hypothetical protein
MKNNDDVLFLFLRFYFRGIVVGKSTFVFVHCQLIIVVFFLHLEGYYSFTFYAFCYCGKVKKGRDRKEKDF